MESGLALLTRKPKAKLNLPANTAASKNRLRLTRRPNINDNLRPPNPIMTDSPQEVWFATLEVAPRDPNSVLGESAGAFVTVMGISATPREFRRKLYEFMEREQLDIMDIQNAEPLELRLEFVELD